MLDPIEKSICEWELAEVMNWVESLNLEIKQNKIDCLYPICGFSLLKITEDDLKILIKNDMNFIKLFYHELLILQLKHADTCKLENCKMKQHVKSKINIRACSSTSDATTDESRRTFATGSVGNLKRVSSKYKNLRSFESNPNQSKIQFSAKHPNEAVRCSVAIFYGFSVAFLSSLVLSYVQSRVPDMDEYPPLPDIVLLNLPLISWAFVACEYLIVANLLIFTVIVFHHKYRLVVLKRFFSIAGTIFLMRCITLFATTLSVPGKHLNCKAQIFDRAVEIFLGAGLSINGLRTCGDYMFSGHTSMATCLVMFISEYAPLRWQFLHNMIWLNWGFTLFFILAGHEHYTIDVICAVYLTMRVFQYYHTLITAVNFNRNRAKIMYPIFTYMEYPFDCAWVPNEFENPMNIFIRTKNMFVPLMQK